MCICVSLLQVSVSPHSFEYFSEVGVRISFQVRIIGLGLREIHGWRGGTRQGSSNINSVNSY